MKNEVTAQLVKEYLLQNVFLRDYLKRDLINVQALARELLPMIEQRNPKATIESISVAIKRMPSNDDAFVTKQLKNVLHHVQLNTRSDMVLFCLKKGSPLPKMNDFDSDDVFFMNQGSNEVTVIIDRKNSHLISSNVLLKQDHLALISIRDTLLKEKKNYRVTPGFVHAFLSNISREGINLNDILSSYSQVTLVVEQKYLMKVYEICQRVKKLEYW